jgi:hypothetical protein
MKEEKKPITVAETVRQFEQCAQGAREFENAVNGATGVFVLMTASLRHFSRESLSDDE